MVDISVKGEGTKVNTHSLTHSLTHSCLLFIGNLFECGRLA